MTDDDDTRVVLCQLIPATGWEMLSLCTEEDGSESMQVTPVIAWGLVKDGCRIHPSTANDLDLMYRDTETFRLRYGLCQTGRAEVYGNNESTYSSRDDWFAAALADA
jgi:hypothetical protein